MPKSLDYGLEGGGAEDIKFWILEEEQEVLTLKKR